MSASPAGDALAVFDSCSVDDEHCITCGDVAVELTVRSIDAERGLALCEDDEGRRESVETALLDAVGEGDRILVHAGTAIAPAAERPAGRRDTPGREAEEVVRD